MVCFTLHTWIFGSCCFLHPPPKSKDGHTSIPLIWRSEKRFWAQRYWCPNHILERVVQNWCSVVKANFSKWFIGKASPPKKMTATFQQLEPIPGKKWWVSCVASGEHEGWCLQAADKMVIVSWIFWILGMKTVKTTSFCFQPAPGTYTTPTVYAFDAPWCHLQ